MAKKDSTDKKMAEDEIRNIYELSKITNTTKQILDEFTSTITMLMFSEYIKTFDNPYLTLSNILNNWEKQVVDLKKIEIDTLINQTESMSDLTVGNILAEGTDLQNYINSVADIKDSIEESISREL